jgi:Protein of unknown function (DUF2844)
VTKRNKKGRVGLGNNTGATSVSGANQKVILMTIKQHEMGRGWAWAKLTAVALMAFRLSLPAFAALGGDVTSVHADQASMKASIKTTTSQAYTLHEIKTPMGMIVHEFVSADGRVFGVAWHGPAMPPMQQILGTYFQQFSAGVQAHHAAHVGRSPLNIQQPGLVVQSSGHPRGFFGRAYVPGMLPQGVTPDQIR